MVYLDIMAAPIKPHVEAKVVALFARGDTYEQIMATVEKEDDRILSRSGVQNIIRRNKAVINHVKNKTVQKQVADAEAIRDKANAALNAKMDETDRNTKLIAKMADQYLRGEITALEYRDLRRLLRAPTIPELVTVSKEMHAQTGTADAPASNVEELAAIRKALEEGDEVTLTHLMFKKNGAPADDSNINSP